MENYRKKSSHMSVMDGDNFSLKVDPLIETLFEDYVKNVNKVEKSDS